MFETLGFLINSRSEVTNRSLDYYGIEAKQNELAVKSFFPQSYGTFKQRDIWEITDFSDMAHGTKKMFLLTHLIDIREEPD